MERYKGFWASYPWTGAAYTARTMYPAAEKSEKGSQRIHTALWSLQPSPWWSDYACMQPIRRQLQGSHQGRDGSGKQATQTDERSQQPLWYHWLPRAYTRRRKAGGKRIWALQGWIWKGESPAGPSLWAANPSLERSPAIHEKPLRRHLPA